MSSFAISITHSASRLRRALRDSARRIMEVLFEQSRRLRRELPFSIQRTHVLWALTVLFAVAFLLFARGAAAGFWSSAVGHLAQVIVGFLGRVLTAEIGILLAVTQYNDFITSPPVTLGWTIVRDIVNMFFVLLLLVIALATILHYEEYTYKKLLKDVILAAILVNFSKTIAGFFIDFAQVIMMTFVNGFAIAGAGAGNFVDLLQLREMMSLDDAGTPGAEEISTANLVTAMLFAVVFMLISVVVVGVMLAVFVFRILVLWALVVLSPLTYLLNTFPGGKKYAQQWWDMFTNFVVVGPVLAFFLWLSLATVSEREGQVGTAVVPAGTGQFETVGVAKGQDFDSMTSFVVGIGMLIMSLVMAQQMGGVAGQLAGSALSKIQSAGFGALKAPLAPLGLAWKGAKFGGGLVAQRAERGLLQMSNKEGGGKFRRSLKYLTSAGRKGFMQRGEKLLEDQRKIASGKAEREANRLLTSGVVDIPTDQIERSKVVHGYQEDYAKMSRQTFMAQFALLKDLDSPEGALRREALFLSGASKGYLDDAMQQEGIAEGYMKLGKEKYGMEDGERYNELLVGDFMYDYLTGSKAGEGRNKVEKDPNKFQSALWTMDELEDIGKSTYHFEYLGHQSYNPAKNRQEATTITAVGSEGDGKGNIIDEDGNEIQYDGKSVDAAGLAWDGKKKRWTVGATKDKDGNWVKDKDGNIQGMAVDSTSADGKALLRNTRWVNPLQTNFALSEWNKGSSRDSGKVAPHVLNSILGETDAAGNIQYDGDTGMVKSKIGGRLTEGQRRFAKGMTGKRATSAAEHGQVRLKTWMLGEPDEDTTELAMKDDKLLDHLQEFLKVNPYFVKLMYGDMRNISSRPGETVKDITIRVDADSPPGGKGRKKGHHYSTMNEFKQSLEDEVKEHTGKVATKMPQIEADEMSNLPAERQRLLAEWGAADGRNYADPADPDHTRQFAEAEKQAKALIMEKVKAAQQKVQEPAYQIMVEMVGGGTNVQRGDEQLKIAIDALTKHIIQYWEDIAGGAALTPTQQSAAEERAKRLLIKAEQKAQSK